MSMHDDIKNVLVSEEELKTKVRELGAQISRAAWSRSSRTWTVTCPARTC